MDRLVLLFSSLVFAAAQQGGGSCPPGRFWNGRSAACARCTNVSEAGSVVGYTPATPAQVGNGNSGPGVTVLLDYGANYSSCWALCNTTPTCQSWIFGGTGIEGCATNQPSCIMKSTQGFFTNATCRVAGMQARIQAFSYGNSSACSPCATGAVFVSSTGGCTPSTANWPGRSDTAFFFSGSSSEGFAAFAATQPGGLSYATDVFSNVHGATVVAAGTSLTTTALGALPTLGEDRTIAAWIRCPVAPPGSKSVGLLAFSNGSEAAAQLIVYGNTTISPVSGLSVAPCADCYRSLVSTTAGNGSAGSADGLGTNARFDGMAHVVLDAAGNAYIADTESRIRVVSPAGYVVTLAGNGTYASVDGFGTSACINKPRGICLDANETALFVTQVSTSAGNSNAACIRRIALSSGEVTTIAGNCDMPGFGDGAGSDARFSVSVWCCWECVYC